MTGRPASLAERERRLRAALASGEVWRRAVPRGSGVSIVACGDGSLAVSKDCAWTGPEREALCAAVADALGLRPPAVLCDGTHAWMEFVKGDLGAALPDEERKAALASPVGRRIALLDQLIVNPDRHLANWIMTADGPVPIDHGAAFWMAMAPGTPVSGGFGPPPELSPQEWAAVAPALEALRGRFAAACRENWHDRMMEEARTWHARSMGLTV